MLRRVVCWLVASAMIVLAWGAQAAPAKKKKSTDKKSAARKGSKKRATAKKGAGKTAASGSASTTSARKSSGTKKSASRGKSSKKAAPRTTWRNRQLTPSSDRYREIQTALVAKGYLKEDHVTGSWDAASTDALKRFQADQKIDSNGKINSLSLIALGLGPKREPLPPGKPTAAPTPEPRP
jgi:hypothetical protein